MSFSVKYSKSRRMIISGLSCDCSYDHRTITQDVYIGSGVLNGLAAMVKRRDMGSRLVLVSDRESFESAGKRTQALLEGEGYSVTPVVFDSKAVSDENSAGLALLSMRMDTDFFVSAGSGSVADITRIVASKTERPFVCVATAPSTSAYPSPVSYAKLQGFITRVKAVSPEIVVCDSDIISKAPKSMIAAGFAEMMAKFVSVADWRLGRLICCEKMCPTYAQAVLFAADRVLEAADGIAAADTDAIETLMESLVICGLVIAMTGSVRPVESTAAAIADYCKMKLNGASYGDLLAFGVDRSLMCVEQIRNMTDFAEAGYPDFEAEIRDGFGADAEKVAELWPDLGKAFFTRQSGAFVKRFSSVKSALGDVPDRRVVLDCMAKVGCDLGAVDGKTAHDATKYAPYLTGFFSLMTAARLFCDG